MFGYCSGMGAGGWLMMIGLWAAFLALVVWAVTRVFPTDRRRAAGDLLDHRFAAGEIDAATYREARDELSGAQRTAGR